MEVPSFKPLDQEELYAVLTQQANGSEDEASWLDGFELRPFDYDPQHQAIFDSRKVFFQKPPEADVEPLRNTIFKLARPFFIEDEAWAQLKDVFYGVYTDQAVQEFSEERAANIFFGFVHSQFFDIAIGAAASLDVRSELPDDNHFAHPKDPAHNQMLISNRVLTVMEHKLFKQFTGDLPVLEGLMEPLADVMTTIAANGSGRVARTISGMRLRPTIDQTTEQTAKMLTKGEKLIFMAPSSNPAHIVLNKEGQSVRQVDKISKETGNLISSHNRGPARQHKNLYIGISLDCSPLNLSEGPHTGLATTAQVYVPRSHKHVEWVMRDTVEEANTHLREPDMASFYYEGGDLSRRDRHHLGHTALSNY